MADAERQQMGPTALLTRPTPSSQTRRSEPRQDPAIAEVGNRRAQQFAASCPLRLPSPSVCPFGGVCSSCPVAVQAKLVVGAPDDKYEKEADRIADEVMRMPDPQVQRTSSTGEEEDDELRTKPLADRITPLVQRQPAPAEEDEEEPIQTKPDFAIRRQAEEPEDEEEEPIQAKPSSSGPVQVSPRTEALIQSLRGGGRPLSQSERGFFEPRFGCGFSQVVIHRGDSASRAAEALGSQAFAVGRHVVLGSSQLASRTTSRNELVAHELAHTVQHGVCRTETVLPSERSAARPLPSKRESCPVVQRHDDPSLWCNALRRLVAYEEKHGQLRTIVEYNPCKHTLLTGLNHDIPSIYGDVDVDWMLRLTGTQMMSVGPSIISPSIGQQLGLVSAHIGYLGAKTFWNLLRSISEHWDLELSSLFQTANLNAPSVVVHWIHEKSLREIFKPALELCGEAQQ